MDSTVELMWISWEPLSWMQQKWVSMTLPRDKWWRVLGGPEKIHEPHSARVSLLDSLWPVPWLLLIELGLSSWVNQRTRKFTRVCRTASWKPFNRRVHWVYGVVSFQCEFTAENSFKRFLARWRWLLVSRFELMLIFSFAGLSFHSLFLSAGRVSHRWPLCSCWRLNSFMQHLDSRASKTCNGGASKQWWILCNMHIS